MFPITLTLGVSVNDITPPGGVVEVLKNLLMNVVDNPVKALFNANYIGILAWALILGLALKNAAESTKTMISNVADALSQIVRWIINFAPFGIMGLVFDSIATQGLETLLGYGQLIILLVGTMAFIALVVNPVIVFIGIRKNPYPLVLKCLNLRGITAILSHVVQQQIYQLIGVMPGGTRFG